MSWIQIKNKSGKVHAPARLIARIGERMTAFQRRLFDRAIAVAVDEEEKEIRFTLPSGKSERYELGPLR